LEKPDVILTRLTFDTLGVGISPLNFTVDALENSLGNPLAADLGNGSVTVVSVLANPIPEPSSMLLLGLGLILLSQNIRRANSL
jgi:hypothetical protein